MDGAVAIGGWGLVASLVPVVVVAGISLARRLGLERDLLVAVARSIAQLLLAGWGLTLLLDGDRHLAWAWAWVSLMVPMAGDAARRRERRLPGLGLSTTLGGALGLAVSLGTVFGLGILPLEARVLVPVAGMVVGNSLKVVVVAATRLVDGLRDRRGEVEAMLAAGWLGEIRGLLERWPRSARAFGSVGYAQLVAHLRDGVPMDETRQAIRKATRVYARRQRTWFKNEPGIDWRTDATALTAPRGVARVTQWWATATDGA